MQNTFLAQMFLSCFKVLSGSYDIRVKLSEMVPDFYPAYYFVLGSIIQIIWGTELQPFHDIIHGRKLLLTFSK